ncbi:MAG: two pore domain potassium channel family protein [Nitrospiraceae bacterium]|nr:MAG: two pore domain potassium channel family protein [Nitrospiraceae bacterium]
MLSLLIMFVLSPFSEKSFIGVRFINILFILILLISMYVMSRNRIIFLISLFSAGIAVVANILMYVFPHPTLTLLTFVFYACFSIVMAITVLIDVVKPGEISGDRICGAICVYLFMGLIWAFFYDILETIYPGSFLFPDPEITASAPDHGFSQSKYASLSYFSFVTLSTLGYGDIIPLVPPARTLAFLEAVVGQLYIAILIARLVGMHIAHSYRERN